MNQIPNIEEEKVAIKLWNIALDEDNKNARQEFRDVLHQQLQKARQDIHTSLVAAVEGMKEDGDTPFGTQELHETELAYNQALDDTLTIINSIFKE